MKVAIPTNDSKVDNHFGHCKAYTVITLDEKKNEINREVMPSPQGCGCKSNIASILQEQGVTVMLAGSMGAGAVNVLSNHGINVVRGCAGEIDHVIENYVNGKLTDSGESCSEHGDGEHQCQH